MSLPYDRLNWQRVECCQLMSVQSIVRGVHTSGLPTFLCSLGNATNPDYISKSRWHYFRCLRAHILRLTSTHLLILSEEMCLCSDTEASTCRIQLMIDSTSGISAEKSPSRLSFIFLVTAIRIQFACFKNWLTVCTMVWKRKGWPAHACTQMTCMLVEIRW